MAPFEITDDFLLVFNSRPSCGPILYHFRDTKRSDGQRLTKKLVTNSLTNLF